MAVTVSRSKYADVKRAVKNSTTKTNIGLAVEIVSQAKVLAPVDLGQLRNSISASSLTKDYMLNDSEGEKAEPLNTTGLTGNEVFAGTSSDHAIFQEYGTVKQPAQPFLRPSAELILSKKKVEKIMSDYSREAMEAEFKKRKKTVVKNG